MSSAVANPVDRFSLPSREDPNLRKFLVYSSILHSLLVAWIAATIYFHLLPGPEWTGYGSTDGSVKVKLVSGPAAGLPMPTPPSITESKSVDVSKGLWTEEPPPKPEPPTNAEKIAPFKHEKPLPPTHHSKVDQPRIPPPDNAVNFGKHGAPPLPTSYAPNPGAGSGPVSINPGQGGGDFASRYAWYIESVRRTVAQNWLQSTIDPAVRAARQAHTVMTFRIYRDGSVRNIQMAQSSGNLSMDNSARRALDGIQFSPLPNDYSGSFVDVTFDFDLSLAH
jgi:TonB family protein